MDIPDAFREYLDQVSVPDPALDQAFSGVRDALEALGIANVTPKEALVALSVLIMGEMETSNPGTKVAIAAYLGTLLEEKGV